MTSNKKFDAPELGAHLDGEGKSYFTRGKTRFLNHGEAVRLVPILFEAESGKPRFVFEIAEGARARERVSIALGSMDSGGDDWAALAAGARDAAGRWPALWSQVWEVKATIGWNRAERWPRLKLLQITVEPDPELVESRRARYIEINSSGERKNV